MLLYALLDIALASSAGKTGSSTSGCGGGCHGGAASAATTVRFSASDTVAAPGERLNLSLVVSHATLSGAGLNVSATGGTLGAGANTRVSGGEVTHSSAQAMAGGSVTFNFTWTAPSAEGTYTLRGAGNAVDRDRNADTDDKWALASNLTLTVDDGCDDLDGDGYEACDDGSGDDCDDTDAWISPEGEELCDGVDQDCDGILDEDPVEGTEIFPDADGDGYGASRSTASHTCDGAAPAGWSLNRNDCDDTNAAVNPGAPEICGGLDDDCDGAADGPDAADATTWYRDADGDGFGTPGTSARSCYQPAGYVADAADCDDGRATVNPDAVEVCDAADLDEDCDGLADDDDASVTGATAWYADADADGYGAGTAISACDAPAGHSALSGDCDDADRDYHPAAVESCDDEVDYNCDGSTGFDDTDGDGVPACEDCDDRDAAVHPGASETCNALDDDCDGTVDEADAADARAWYVDADGDGWGSAAATSIACSRPAGFDDDALDCDDTTADVRPDAPEAWYDGVDQNCDGNDDDQDGDGSPFGEDCDETRADVYPGGPDEWYDGIDGDCAGNSDYDADGDGQDSASYGGTDCDDADPAVYLGAPDAPYDGVVTDCVAADEFDQDGDGFELDADCDDARSDVHPDAAEAWYDGVDQDCDGNDDDQDGDGVPVDADCDDEDPAVAACDTGSPDTGQDIGNPSDVDDPKDPEGCGCATGPTGGAGLLGLIAAFALRRRSRG